MNKANTAPERAFMAVLFIGPDHRPSTVNFCVGQQSALTTENVQGPVASPIGSLNAEIQTGIPAMT